MSKALKHTLATILTIVVVIVVTGYWWYESRFAETDDAYVQAHSVEIAPQVNGPISKIFVKNYEMVKQGQPLFDINPAPFEVSVEEAQAGLELAKQQEVALQEGVTVAQANVNERQAQLILAQKKAKRVLALVKQDHLSPQAGDEATSQLDVAQAALVASQEQLKQAIAKLGQPGANNAQVKQATAQLKQAQLNLKHTHVIAPISGQLLNFSAQLGTLINSGEPTFAGPAVATIINTNSWWVSANFKETDLANIKPDQTVRITTDIYPGHIYKGIVSHISRGSGASFSLLPPENATGNWVKVTQRFPVKILIVKPSAEFPLRVGASASVKVETK